LVAAFGQLGLAHAQGATNWRSVRPVPDAMQARRGEPLPIDVALNIRTFAYPPISVSPDGKWVAYTVFDNARAPAGTGEYRTSPTGVNSQLRDTDVWVTNTITGESRNLTQGRGANYAPAWSTDARRLAFYSDRDGAARVWIWDGAAGALRRMSSAIAWDVSRPVAWTPDGRRVITAALPVGVRLDQVYRSLHDEIAAQTPDREPESSVVVYRFHPRPPESGSAVASPPNMDTRTLASSPAMDLVAIQTATGDVDRLGTGLHYPAWWLSPDGAHVAFSTFKRVLHLTPSQDLAVVSLKDRSSSVVVTDAQFNASLSWSPDGAQFAYTTIGVDARGDIVLVPVTGGRPRNLTPAQHPYWDWGDANPNRGPVWDPTGNSLYAASANSIWRIPVASGEPSKVTTIAGAHMTSIVSAGNAGRFWSTRPGTMVVMAVDTVTLNAALYAVHLANGAATALLQRPAVFDDGDQSKTDYSSDGLTMVFVSQDATHPADLWVAHASDLHDAHQLTHMNPSLERYPVGASRLIEWRSATGASLRGTLLLPAGYDSTKRYPLIVRQYPGALGSTYVHRYGGSQGSIRSTAGVDNWQLLATRHYAVLIPDVPFTVANAGGESDEVAGLAYRSSATPANRMQQVADAVLPGVDRVVELGIADPERLGVMGCSYGGWSTVSLLTLSTRFRAAIAGSGGYYDSPRTYGSLAPDGQSLYTTTSELTYGGTLWTRRDVYLENSPVFFLDRVETPLLLTAGGRDVYVNSDQTEEVFVGLRRLGKEVEYAKYVTASHCEDMSRADQADYVKRMIDWFDSHLKGGVDRP